MPVENRLTARPPVVLLAAFSRAALSAHPWVLSNSPVKCEVDRTAGRRENRRTQKLKEAPLIMELASEQW